MSENCPHNESGHDAIELAKILAQERDGFRSTIETHESGIFNTAIGLFATLAACGGLAAAGKGGAFKYLPHISLVLAEVTLFFGFMVIAMLIKIGALGGYHRYLEEQIRLLLKVDTLQWDNRVYVNFITKSFSAYWLTCAVLALVVVLFVLGAVWHASAGLDGGKYRAILMLGAGVQVIIGSILLWCSSRLGNKVYRSLTSRDND